MTIELYAKDSGRLMEISVDENATIE